MGWRGSPDSVEGRRLAGDFHKQRGGGDTVDSKDVRKHPSDILRLPQLLAQDTRIEVIARVANNLLRFLDALWADDSADPKTLKLEDVTAVEFEFHIVRTYGSRTVYLNLFW